MWILTEEYNDYDQHGAYFVTAWTEKPSREEVARVCGIDTSGRFTNSDKMIDHMLLGGGRVEYEYQWYNLIEVQSGEL